MTQTIIEPKVVPYKEWVYQVISHHLFLNNDSDDLLTFSTDEIECDTCAGDGAFHCFECDGSGVDGDEEDDDYLEDCYVCDGTGDRSCLNCNGTGIVIPDEYEELNISLNDYNEQITKDREKWEEYKSNLK